MKLPSLSVPSLTELYSREYDAGAMEWRRLGAIDKVGHIRTLIGDRAPDVHDVLEVGCGTGDVIAGLARTGLGQRHVGIEIGTERLEHARQDIPSLTLSYYDGARMDFLDRSFDLVYATHVLEHVVNEREFLHEMRRVARKLIYVEVPLEIHGRTSWQALNTSLQIGHINAYSMHSFLLKLETSGLRVIDARLFDHSFPVHRYHSSPFSALLKTSLRRVGLASGIGTALFTYHCGALCEVADRLDIA